MRDVICRMVSNSAVRVGALTMLLCASASAEEAGDLEACAKLEDPQARLACYDDASQRAAKPAELDGEATPAPESPESSAPEQSAPPSDTVSDEQPSSSDPKDGPVRATLTECRKGPTGKWYFFLDNGQVWEQRDNDRFSMRDCSGEVTITKDFFGYKIKFSHTDNKIRAGRAQ